MGGKIDDRGAFIETVLKTDLAGSTLGTTVKFNPYGNPIYDVYIRKVVKRPDGKYWNVLSGRSMGKSTLYRRARGSSLL